MERNTKSFKLTYYLTSLGCSKNLVDSELLVYALDQENFEQVKEPSEADIIVINTCGFIEAAQQESINAILEAEEYKGTGRCRQLVVVGCLAQRFGRELFDSLPQIDIVLGTGNFMELPALLRKRALYQDSCGERLCQVGIPSFSYPEAGKRTILTPSHSVYLKIAEGCSNCCSYCAIPSIRGKYRSRPKKILLEEAEGLLKGGAREINLIAQETSAYGLDLKPPEELADLLEALAVMEGIGWIRFLYTYPTRITERLLKVIKAYEPICSYMDLPLQHVNETILRNMNRVGSSESLYRLFSSIRDTIPDITLRTTFIVGFPGETSREFEELMEFVEKVQFDWVGVFPFSPQEGTPAYNLKPVVSKKEANRRAEELMLLQQGITQKRNLRFLGRVVKVLVEGKSEETPELFTGRTEGQAPEVDGIVLMQGADEQDVGKFLEVKITHVDNYDLVGEVVE